MLSYQTYKNQTADILLWSYSRSLFIRFVEVKLLRFVWCVSVKLHFYWQENVISLRRGSINPSASSWKHVRILASQLVSLPALSSLPCLPPPPTHTQPTLLVTCESEKDKEGAKWKTRRKKEKLKRFTAFRETPSSEDPPLPPALITLLQKNFTYG